MPIVADRLRPKAATAGQFGVAYGRVQAAATRLQSEPEQATITRATDGMSARFGDLFYMLHSTRSGKHHADGVLWGRNCKHEAIEDRVTLTRIAPSILAEFGLSGPEYISEAPRRA